MVPLAPHVAELPVAAEEVFSLAEEAEAISVMNETAVTESMETMSQMSSLTRAVAAPPIP